MPRIALIGLSSPIAYDYEHPAEESKGSVFARPNPLLESAFGLMLLYDELWFVSRDLCPANMRSLPYVRLLADRGELPPLDNMTPRYIVDTSKMSAPLRAQYQQYEEHKWTAYRDTLASLPLTWDAVTDNHSQNIEFPDFEARGNSAALATMAFDVELVRRLAKPNLELIANSVSRPFLEDPSNALVDSSIAQRLVLHGIG